MTDRTAQSRIAGVAIVEALGIDATTCFDFTLHFEAQGVIAVTTKHWIRESSAAKLVEVLRRYELAERSGEADAA